MNAVNVSYPHRGIKEWDNPRGIHILRLHYSADEVKTAAWAAMQKAEMANPANYEQEYEIDFSATLGSLVYLLDEEATLEDSFPIPENWTRRMSLDPHPSVPHAFLWVATDTYGDRWYYREFWPSKALGQRGPCPEDDARYTIKQYVSAVRYFESKDNPENCHKGRVFDERIQARVIDYAARAFAAETREGQRQMSFQQVYEAHMAGTCECDPPCPPLQPAYFEDSRKDHAVGEELVNAGLKAVMSTDGNDKERKSSRIHIFRDRCQELIYELKNVRHQQLTPLMASRMDPTGKPVEVRKHMVDNLRYLEMSGPTYIERRGRPAPYEPPEMGLSY